MKTDKYLGHYKARLFSELSGTVLEIGSGAGANLHYFPSTGITWIGVDPNPFMKPHLLKEAHRLDLKIELRDGIAETLPAADESVDFVISTLVLCSVVDQKRALRGGRQGPQTRRQILVHRACCCETWKLATQDAAPCKTALAANGRRLPSR